MPESKSDYKKSEKATDNSKKRKVMDQVFYVLIVVLVVLSVLSIGEYQKYVAFTKERYKEDCALAHKLTGFKMPEVNEFITTFVAAIACYLLHVLFDIIVYPLCAT